MRMEETRSRTLLTLQPAVNEEFSGGHHPHLLLPSYKAPRDVAGGFC